MRIDKIEIKSYRSIAHLKFRVNNIGLIVGPNDAGKSNILSAIKLFFDCNAQTTSEDINSITKRTQTDISISFSALNASEQKLLKKWNPGTNPTFMSIRKICEINKKPRYVERNSNNQISPGAIEKFLLGRFLLIPSQRDASEEFANNVGSLFTEFISVRNKKLSEYRLNNMRRDWDNGLARFRKHLNKNLEEIIGKVSVSLGVDELVLETSNSIDNILQCLILNIFNKYGKVPLSRHGHGIQSMLVMALHEALSSSERLLFIALEEPENHLHPNLIHHLMSRFLTKSGSRQWLVSTHSPIIVSHVQVNNIIRIMKDNEGLTCVTEFLNNDKGCLQNKSLKLLNPIRNEVLFADKVILCEGDTECVILPNLGARLGVEYDIVRDNIACVNCEGEAFGDYIKLLNKFKIPWAILCDNAFWQDGKWHKMASSVNLDKEARIIFKRIHPSKGLTFSSVSKILKDKFRTVCLDESIEAVILGNNEKHQRSVAEILKLVCPGKYQDIISSAAKVNKNNLIEVMKKNKPIWAKAISIVIAPEDASDEFKKLLINLKKVKFANSIVYRKPKTEGI